MQEREEKTRASQIPADEGSLVRSLLGLGGSEQEMLDTLVDSASEDDELEAGRGAAAAAAAAEAAKPAEPSFPGNEYEAQGKTGPPYEHGQMNEEPAPPKRTRVIMDCDTGSDDAIALMYAALNPDMDLIGVTTIEGPSLFPPQIVLYFQMALRLLTAD